VVGWSTTDKGLHAFITGPNGAVMTDLNSLVNLPAEVTLTQAVAINNSGQILAVGTIPEPDMSVLLLRGLILIGFAARERRQRIQLGLDRW
jgi:probable HAF family extracellular repeat protein